MIPQIYGSSKCLLPHENPGSKRQNMVAFATKIPWISSPVTGRLVHNKSSINKLYEPNRQKKMATHPEINAYGWNKVAWQKGIVFKANE